MLNEENLGGLIAHPAAAATVGWQSLDINFAALGATTPQDFKAGGDGVYVIGGVNWTVANTASCTSASIGATGIGAVTTSGNINPPAAITSIMMNAALTSYIPGLTMSNAVRVKVYNSVNNRINSWELFAVRISAAQPNEWERAFYYTLSGFGNTLSVYASASGGGTYLTDAINMGNNVYEIEIPWLERGLEVRGRSGVFAGGWPLDAAMIDRGQDGPSVVLAAAPNFAVPADVRVGFTAQCSPTVPAFDFRIARMMIEWK